MGLTHLEQIKELLRKNPGREYGKREIRDHFGFNYNIVLDVLSYLHKEKKIRIIKNKIQWRQDGQDK